MAHVVPVQEWESKVWVSPLWDFTKIGVTEYVRDHGLARNPVSDALHMSGECLCGAFAHPGELDTLALWYPAVAAEIRALEGEVAAAGFPWGWEHGPPRGYRKEQPWIEGFMPLCASCLLTHRTDPTQGAA